MYENNGLDPMFQEENNGMWGAASETLSRYTAKTFGWMGLGLLCTFAIAFASYATGFVWYSIIQVPYLPFILAIAEIVVVMVLDVYKRQAQGPFSKAFCAPRRRARRSSSLPAAACPRRCRSKGAARCPAHS